MGRYLQMLKIANILPLCQVISRKKSGFQGELKLDISSAKKFIGRELNEVSQSVGDHYVGDVRPQLWRWRQL